jgi:polyisoprenoid-binding protein YceI
VKGRAETTRIVNHTLVSPVGTFELDPVHTFVGFSAQHLVVSGSEAVSRRYGAAEDPSASTAGVSIEAASITTQNSTRDDDLPSGHYLDVERNPAITFRSHATYEVNAGACLLTGDLTLHGATSAVELIVRFGGAVTDGYGNARSAFSTHGFITRHDFGLKHELINTN